MSTDYLNPSNPICSMTASELVKKVRAGELTAQEAVEAHIERIQEINPSLNAVVIPTFDEARQSARMADRRRLRGEQLGPLHGLPISIKEQYIVAGTQTTLGARHQVGKTYDTEGPMVTALRKAGAIILGKTNIIQTLAGWESDNRVYGRTNNPWDPSRTPGGSSGGESALVASGGSPLGLAGDLGGSIRIPAHFCGVHGLKPTAGRLSNGDFPPGLLSDGQEVIIAQPGPIARSIGDLNLAMEVLAETSLGPTPDFTPPVPWQDPGAITVEGMRIGIYTDSPFFAVSPSVRTTVEMAAEALEARGAEIVAIPPPDLAEGVRLFLGILSASGGEDYKRLLGAEKPIPQVAGMLQGMYSPNFMLSLLSRIMAARGQEHLANIMGSMGSRSAAEYWKLIEDRNAFRAGFRRRLENAGIEAVICPPFALPAPTHGASTDLFPAAAYAFVYNVLGNPAGVVSLSQVHPEQETDRPESDDPVDRTARLAEMGSAGLPVGVQVVGRHWREDVVLAVMQTLEEEFQERPTFPIRTFSGHALHAQPALATV